MNEWTNEWMSEFRTSIQENVRNLLTIRDFKSETTKFLFIKLKIQWKNEWKKKNNNNNNLLYFNKKQSSDSIGHCKYELKCWKYKTQNRPLTKKKYLIVILSGGTSYNEVYRNCCYIAASGWLFLSFHDLFILAASISSCECQIWLEIPVNCRSSFIPEWSDQKSWVLLLAFNQ